MSVVLVTGANGFMGKNLISKLRRLNGMEILSYDIENTEEELKNFIGSADFIFHLAGVNRPRDPGEYEVGNAGFTRQLIDIIRESKRSIPVLLSSSIQAALDNPYGISKREAEDEVFRYGRDTGVRVCVYRLPNVFGKWCRPNYNSVVATWCYNISRNLPIQINNPETELNLVYIDDVVDEFIKAVDGFENRGSDGFCHIKREFKTTLGELSNLLHSFHDSRETLIIPDLKGDFERFMYSVYLSYIPENELGYGLLMRGDGRGWLSEIIKSKNFGQIFVSKTKPGITRGNHFHHTKVEKFIVIEGEGIVRLRCIYEDKAVEYRVSGEKLKVIDIPPGYTHSITNIGDTDLITLFWADEIYDSESPDTYRIEV